MSAQGPQSPKLGFLQRLLNAFGGKSETPSATNASPFDTSAFQSPQRHGPFGVVIRPKDPDDGPTHKGPFGVIVHPRDPDHGPTPKGPFGVIAHPKDPDDGPTRKGPFGVIAHPKGPLGGDGPDGASDA